MRRGKEPRCVVADPHEIAREGIAERLSRSDVRLIAETVDGYALVALVREQAPDIVVTDVELRGKNGISAVVDIRRFDPTVAIVVYTEHEEPLLGDLAREIGATAFVPKARPMHELDQALRMATNGPARSFDPMPERKRRPRLAGFLELSASEEQTLRLLQQGLNDQEIAQRLHLQPGTIPRNVERARKKLRVDSREAAVALSIRFGYLGSAVGQTQSATRSSG